MVSQLSMDTRVLYNDLVIDSTGNGSMEESKNCISVSALNQDGQIAELMKEDRNGEQKAIQKQIRT